MGASSQEDLGASLRHVIDRLAAMSYPYWDSMARLDLATWF